MIIEPIATDVRGLTLRGLHYLPSTSSAVSPGTAEVDAAPPPSGAETAFPTAVLLHGFGGSRVETTGVFVALARTLVAAGIGVVAFDRAGHGESDGDFFDTTASGDIADTREVLAAVRTLPGVDPRDLHLVGMSLGSVIAAAVAAEEPDLRSLTMWSTASVFVEDIRSGQIQGRSLAGLDEPGGFFDFLGMRMGPAMRQDALAFDPYARAAAYRGPALLLHGTLDFVPVRCAERYTAEDVFGDRAELVVVDGADHGWAQLPQRDELIARTTRFLQSHIRKAGR